jgi:hypothetical protein
MLGPLALFLGLLLGLKLSHRLESALACSFCSFFGRDFASLELIGGTLLFPLKLGKKPLLSLRRHLRQSLDLHCMFPIGSDLLVLHPSHLTLQQRHCLRRIQSLVTSRRLLLF